MSIELVMPSNHLIPCRPLLLLHSISPRIRVFSKESVLRIRWPKYWGFNFSTSSSNEYSGLISFRMDWILNSSTRIPSPPLPLFVVMLPKVHLTTFQDVWLQVSVSMHTIMIIWVTKIFFVQFFCVFLLPPLNIICFCQVHTISVLYCVYLCMKCSLGI